MQLLDGKSAIVWDSMNEHNFMIENILLVRADDHTRECNIHRAIKGALHPTRAIYNLLGSATSY